MFSTAYNPVCWLSFKTIKTNIHATNVALQVPVLAKQLDVVGDVHGNPAIVGRGGRSGSAFMVVEISSPESSTVPGLVGVAQLIVLISYFRFVISSSAWSSQVWSSFFSLSSSAFLDSQFYHFKPEIF